MEPGALIPQRIVRRARASGILPRSISDLRGQSERSWCTSIVEPCPSPTGLQCHTSCQHDIAGQHDGGPRQSPAKLCCSSCARSTALPISYMYLAHVLNYWQRYPASCPIFIAAALDTAAARTLTAAPPPAARRRSCATHTCGKEVHIIVNNGKFCAKIRCVSAHISLLAWCHAPPPPCEGSAHAAGDARLDSRNCQG